MNKEKKVGFYQIRPPIYLMKTVLPGIGIHNIYDANTNSVPRVEIFNQMVRQTSLCQP